MANKKFNAHNIWVSVCNTLSTVWSVCVNIFGAFLWIIITVIRVIFLYNPIVFPIVMIFGHREDAAEVLLGKKKSVLDELWDLLPMCFCRWEVFLLPWFIRKDFVRIYPYKFSLKNQIKLAMCLSHDELKSFIDEMEDKAVDLLWKQGVVRCNLVIAEKQPKLTMKTLEFWLQQGQIDKIKQHISKNTPPAEYIQEMIRGAKYFDKRYVAEVLRYTALKHGLSTTIIDMVYAKCDTETAKVVENAVVERNQWLMVNKLKDCNPTNKGLWKQFCEQNPEIWEGAQKMMRFWMLEDYYATEHKLSEGAIIYFLSYEEDNHDDIAEKIFKNEEKLSEKLMTVVRSIPDVYAIYLKISIDKDED